MTSAPCSGGGWVQVPPGIAVEVRGVAKSFRVDGRIVRALDGVDLAVAAGEFATLIGPSGCGKSTLFNIICGLMEPDQGKVLLDGQEVSRHAGRLAYMPQKDLLLPWRSVLDNVILGPEIAGRPRAAARREALELVPLFGLAGFEHSYPAVLSGGMRQRAAFLRAVLQRSPAILLDEPFGALDALTRASLQEWLLEVWGRFGQTVLFITHDVEEALFLADRVYVFGPRPGRVRLTLEVDLPRPRQRAVVTCAAFAALKEELLAALSMRG
ncbi:MAG: ABC transporter ATP-binding protein [Anaerolineae bacterium]|nr:ABC transporter ATP-binding protein [Anaerolineae bacterium]